MSQVFPLNGLTVAIKFDKTGSYFVREAVLQIKLDLPSTLIWIILQVRELEGEDQVAPRDQVMTSHLTTAQLATKAQVTNQN